MSLPMADKGPVSGVSRPILTVPSAMALVAPPAITPATSTVSRTPTHALVLIVPSLVIPSFDLSSGGPAVSHDVVAQIGRVGEKDSRAPLTPSAEASALPERGRRSLHPGSGWHNRPLSERSSVARPAPPPAMPASPGPGERVECQRHRAEHTGPLAQRRRDDVAVDVVQQHAGLNVACEQRRHLGAHHRQQSR